MIEGKITGWDVEEGEDGEDEAEEREEGVGMGFSGETCFSMKKACLRNLFAN